MAITFDNLYTQSIVHLASCPRNVVLPRLYLGAQRFCEKTESWIFTETQNIVADQTDYTLGIPVGITTALIKRLKAVWYGTDSADKSPSQMVDVAKYNLEYEDTLAFVNAYADAVTSGLTTEVVLTPTYADNEITDEMLDRWGVRGFMAWAIWQLKIEKNKTWSDPDGANEWRDKYREAVSAARMNNFRNNKSGDVRVTARPFV